MGGLDAGLTAGRGEWREERMSWEELMEQVLEERAGAFATMAKSMACGKCNCTISVDSEYSCKTCGRMLCLRCGIKWEVCKDHVPVCYHPNIRPTQWNQSRPQPTKVTGSSKNNYSCPVCGYGVGCYPDHLDKLVEEAERNAAT